MEVAQQRAWQSLEVWSGFDEPKDSGELSLPASTDQPQSHLSLRDGQTSWETTHWQVPRLTFLPCVSNSERPWPFQTQLQCPDRNRPHIRCCCHLFFKGFWESVSCPCFLLRLRWSLWLIALRCKSIIACTSPAHTCSYRHRHSRAAELSTAVESKGINLWLTTGMA